MKGKRTIAILLGATGISLIIAQSALAAFTIDRTTKTLDWSNPSGDTYRILSCDNLIPDVWTPGSDTTASSWPITIVDQQYYRLQRKVSTNPDVYQDVDGIVGYSKQVDSSPLSISYRMVANQFFDSNEASSTLGDAFGGQLPVGSEVYTWDGSGYSVYIYYDIWYDQFFEDASNVTIDRGDSVWVKNSSGSTIEYLFAGHVPVSVSTANTLIIGLNMVANPYPTMMTLGDINGAQDGDEIYTHDGITYKTYVYFGGTWLDDFFNNSNNVQVPVGEGFWYMTTVSRDWVMNKPYP